MLASLVVLACITQAVGQGTYTSRWIQDKPFYKPTGNEATLIGMIKVAGQVPPNKIIDMTADPTCVKLNLNPKPQTELILLNEGGLQNAFIYIKKGAALDNYQFEIPTSEVVLQHLNCRYSPHVLGIQKLQRLLVVNKDPTQHNTHPVPKNNPEWNQSQPSEAEPMEKTFARPEMFIPFKDNQHPWEKAYISVLEHPFFAVSNEFGSYQIPGLPPGTYTIVVWHEALGEQEIEITLVPGESRNLDFFYQGEKTYVTPKP